MKKVLLLTALLLALPAHAEWTKIPGTESGAGAAYVDLSTIKVQRSASHQRSAWFIFDLPKPEKGARSVRALLDLDCEDVALSQVVATTFAGQMAKGKMLKEERGLGGRDYVAPGTIMADVLKYVCAYDPKAQ